MRVGVVGGGYWGTKHVRVLMSLASVDQVALVDPRVEAREVAGAANPGLRTFAALDDALPHVDALVIATPPSTHSSLALRALNAGKHVLVEKPMATDVHDARAMVHRAACNGLTLMAGHTFEYNAAVWRLRQAVADGELGDVYYIDTARLNLGLYQPDVNVVWDLAPHDISIVNHVLDATPDLVHAWGKSHAHAYLEDVAHLRLEYRDLEVVADVRVSWLDPRKVRRVTVVGSRKMAVYNDLAEDERIRIYDKGVEAPEALRPARHLGNGNGNGSGNGSRPPDAEGSGSIRYRYGGVSSPSLDFEEPLLVEDRHFVECSAGVTRPSTDGPNGLAVVEVLVAAQTSLREQRPIELDRRAPLSPAVA
jgi:predicted dehydrogenase